MSTFPRLDSFLSFIHVVSGAYEPCTEDKAVCIYDQVLCPDTLICPPSPQPIFHDIEVICVAFFSFDLFTRVLTSWSVSSKLAGLLSDDWDETHKPDDPIPVYGPLTQMRKYFLRVPNVIDFAAIAPFYMNLLITTGGGAFMRVLRLFRLVRVLRLLKALSFLKNVDVTLALIAITIQKSTQTLVVFMFFVMMTSILFGCVIFMCEQGTFTVNIDYPDGAYVTPTADGLFLLRTSFATIPACMYWTFGPDSFPPVTVPGRAITAVLYMVSILGLAFPVGVISMEFEIAYRTETRRLLEISNAKARKKAMDLQREKGKNSKSGSSRRSVASKSDSGSVVDHTTVAADEVIIPPPLPPPLSVHAAKVRDAIVYTIEQSQLYMVELETMKEELLDYDDLRERGTLPRLNAEGKLDPVEDVGKANTSSKSLVERIAAALAPVGKGRLDTIKLDEEDPYGGTRSVY